MNNLEFVKALMDMEELAGAPVELRGWTEKQGDVIISALSLSVKTTDKEGNPKHFDCSVQTADSDELLSLFMPALSRLTEVIQKCKGTLLQTPGLFK